MLIFLTWANDIKWQTAAEGSGGNENNYAAVQDNGDFIIAEGHTVWKALRGSYRSDSDCPLLRHDWR